MSIWWLIPIVLAALGFWATTWRDKPISEEEIKDWEDEHMTMYNGGDDDKAK